MVNSKHLAQRCKLLRVPLEGRVLLTPPSHLGSSLVFSGMCFIDYAQLHVFTFLVPCSDVRCSVCFLCNNLSTIVCDVLFWLAIVYCFHRYSVSDYSFRVFKNIMQWHDIINAYLIWKKVNFKNRANWWERHCLYVL